jgi:HEPN domain-containing protein
MKLVKLASSYLGQARSRLKDAGGALGERNFPYALRLSQECVELSLKASLRLVGIEYPKVHDVSDVLLGVRERFPVWFGENVEEMAKISTSMAMKRELAFDGADDELMPPEEAISRKDAESAVRDAGRVHSLCARLLSEYGAEATWKNT